MFTYEDFFTTLKGERQSLLKVGKQSGCLVIQHPYFHFSGIPYWFNPKKDEGFDNKVLVEQYELKLSAVFSLSEFVTNVEKNFGLSSKNYFWYDTGFWVVELKDGLYLGLGVEAFDKYFLKEHSNTFAVCHSNNLCTTIINSNKKENDKITISVYALNDELPFAEVLDPFRKTIKHYEKANCVNNEMTTDNKLLEHWEASCTIDINPIAFIMDKQFKSSAGFPIIKNPFRKSNNFGVKSLLNIFGTVNGGWVDGDYNGGNKFIVYASVWNFAEVKVVDFVFDIVHRSKEENSSQIC
jgi:hypothetical protein